MRRPFAAMMATAAAATAASCILIEQYEDPVPDGHGGATASSSSAAGGQTTGGSGGEAGTSSSSSSASSTSTSSTSSASSTSTSSSTSTGTSSASSTGGTGCTPNATQTCYTGPAGTLNVGLCHAGQQTCATDGSAWGACVGEVVPAPEDCTTAADENCDGNTPPCAGITLWAKRFGDVQDDNGNDVAADGAGNVYAVGSFRGTADFGGGPVASAGLTDAYLAKYDPTGALLLARRWGDAADQIASGVAVDGAGSIYVAGSFQGTIDFGAPTAPLASAGSNDVFLAKLDTAGAPLWAKRFGDANLQGLAGKGVVVDAAGNAVIAGAFQGSIDFGAGPIASGGMDDAFLARFDASGALVWGHGFGDGSPQQARGVALGPGGRVAITGTVQGSMNFGGGHVVTSAGGHDVFVAVFDAAGACVWAKAFGDAADQDGRAVAFDAAGNVWVTGSFQGSVSFGGGALTAQGTGTNLFVATLDPTGAWVRSQRYGDGAGTGQSGRGVAVDGAGNVLVAGEFGGAMDFGAGPITSAGANDAFLAKLTPALAPLWVNRYGDGSIQSLNAVATDPSLNVLVTGPFRATMDFGVTALISAGGTDAYLAKIAP